MASSYQRNKRFTVVVNPSGPLSINLDSTKAIGHGISEGDILTLRIGPNIQKLVRVESCNNGVWFGLGWGNIKHKFITPKTGAIMFEKVHDKVYNMNIYNSAMIWQKYPTASKRSLPMGFMKTISDRRILNKMRLPMEASNDLSNRVPNPMPIKSDDGRIWFVDWKWDNGCITLEGNWSEVVQRLRICQGDILSFYYDDRNTIEMKRMFMRETDVIFMSLRPTFGATTNGDSNSNGIERVMWTTTITKSSASGSQALNVPILAYNEYFDQQPEGVNFMLFSGQVKTWSLFYNDHERRECHIGKGWYDFITKSDLKNGDKLIFSRIGDENVVRVKAEQINQ